MPQPYQPPRDGTRANFVTIHSQHDELALQKCLIDLDRDTAASSCQAETAIFVDGTTERSSYNAIRDAIKPFSHMQMADYYGISFGVYASHTMLSLVVHNLVTVAPRNTPFANAATIIGLGDVLSRKIAFCSTLQLDGFHIAS